MYEARNAVRILLTDMESIGRIVDTVLAAGASGVGGITYTSTQTSDGRRRAIALAVAEARGDAEAAAGDGALEKLRSENERLAKQAQLVRQEYEAKIERLNARIRELSGSAPAGAGAAEGEKKGFFRR